MIVRDNTAVEQKASPTLRSKVARYVLRRLADVFARIANEENEENVR